MNATVGRVLLGLGAIAILAGCRSGPRLASRPMNDEQAFWAGYLKSKYPAWRPPYLSPVQDAGAAAVQGGRAAAAPPAAALPLVAVAALPPPIPAGAAPTATAAGDDVELVPVEPAAGPDLGLYKVQKGDTLQTISRRVYGTPNEWRRILDANRGVLPSAERLKPGMELRIPPRAR